MKNSKLLLLVLCVVQLAVPGYMIYEQSQILSEGTVYKFQTQPIDPYDPFRGRYVTLTYTINAAPIPSDENLQRDEWAYALLAENDSGFARFTKLVKEEPSSERDYIKIKVGWGNIEHGYNVKIPFNRYYAPEDAAPKIERSVRRRQREENVYAEISVLDGKATLKELYVEGMPVMDYILQAQ
ncbi:MAG: hypothetical protein CMP47_09590 [Rickettsiales bacterium]|jgi:uncharacterized membrane-anchored protein|nr:hypothetical protein [Rickettsiales bacterium]